MAASCRAVALLSFRIEVSRYGNTRHGGHGGHASVKPCRISEGVSHWSPFSSLFGSQITSAEREVGVERSGGRLSVMCLFLRRRYSHGHHTLVHSVVRVQVRVLVCVGPTLAAATLSTNLWTNERVRTRDDPLLPWCVPDDHRFTVGLTSLTVRTSLTCGGAAKRLLDLCKDV